jgi:hypothetical protein
MKRAFFFLVIVGVTIAVVCYVLWLVLDALYSMYQDWRLGKELDELEAYQQEKRQENPAKPPED